MVQKKQFDGGTYNAAGSSYQMQWNIAEGYNIAYQDDDKGSVAVAESMNQVHSECWIVTVMGMFSTGCTAVQILKAVPALCVGDSIRCVLAVNAVFASGFCMLPAMLNAVTCLAFLCKPVSGCTSFQPSSHV